MDNEPTIIGLIAIASTSIIGGIGWLCRAVWSRLFDEENGYISRIVNKHISFLTAIESSVQEMASSQEKQADSITGLGEAVRDLGKVVDRLDSKVEKLNERLGTPK